MGIEVIGMNETLEELIENYINAKEKYETLNSNSHGMIAVMAAQSDYGDATDRLLGFIEKHKDTLIVWERQNVLRLSPFDGD